MRIINNSNEIKNKLTLLGTELYYEIYGEGIPMLMLHGWGVNLQLMSGCMEPIFKDCKTNFKRIYIDLPGMGKSKESTFIKNSDDVLDVIIALIDAIMPEQPFILAGESYGGYLARALIQKRRTQILGLLLICPAVYPGYRKGEVPPLTVLEKDNSFIDTLNDQERTYFESITIVQNEEVWKRFKSNIYDALILHKDSCFLHNVLDGSFSYEVDNLEKPFDKPSLILTARQDTEVGYKDQFKLLENYPRASYVALDKAGHNLQIEQVELFNCLVLEWLDRVVKEK